VRVLSHPGADHDGDGDLIAAELPMSAEAAAQDLTAAVDLARRLREAGCDIVVLPRDDACDLAEVGERIRLEAGLATLVRRSADELDRAATDVLAGRIDLVELVEHEDPEGSRALFAATRTTTGGKA
jgi:beta-glucosidase-like glycosyl hydrolase